jgi:peptidoglycan biosynthesis protein MviN/MurJ (putative lipid II flippase)
MCACRCLGLPSALVLFVTQAFFLAAMDPITPLFAAVLAGGTNLVLDLWLCCGLDWGIAGASLATAIAQVRLHHLQCSTCGQGFAGMQCLGRTVQGHQPQGRQYALGLAARNAQ